MIKVATHNGIFHADEVTATALLKRFYDDSLEVTRLPHQTAEFEEFDLVVDLGKQYDGKKYFDHHHDKELEASNMLIFTYLYTNDYISKIEYEALYELMEIISNNDIGVGDKPSVDSIVKVVQSMNQEDIYSREQDESFWRAVNLVGMYIDNIVDEANKTAERSAKLEKSVEVEPNILELPEFIQGWNTLIFDFHEFKDIDIVMWEDTIQNKWKAQVVPDAIGSFGRRNRALVNKEAEGKEFIHQGEFFCVFDTREHLLNYLKSL